MADLRADFQPSIPPERAGRSEGSVARHELESAMPGQSPEFYYPVFEFKAPDGRSVELRSPSAYQLGCGKYPVGERVTVIYDRMDPTQAQVEGQHAVARNRATLAAIIAAAALIAAAIFLLR